jgi:hypothetical protein
MHDGSAGQEGNTSPNSANYAAATIAPSLQQRRAFVDTNGFIPCCNGARTTPLSSSLLASSAPHRGCHMRLYRLFRPRHRLIRSAKPAAGESRRSYQSMATQLQQRTAACGREQAPHRRVDEVAYAGHQHPRYERLGHQHEHTGVNGKQLSGLTNSVCS